MNQAADVQKDSELAAEIRNRLRRLGAPARVYIRGDGDLTIVTDAVDFLSVIRKAEEADTPESD